MPRLPDLRPDLNACESPHVILLGAGASKAACPKGDRHGKRLPLMSDLLDILGVRDVIESVGVDTSSGNFELIYTDLVRLGPKAEEVRKEVQDRTRDYFAELALPDHVTLYDELITTLRGKDVVATFNWDPFLLQAYARNRRVGPLPRILFLHGNVAVGVCHGCEVKGWMEQVCRSCGSPFEPSQLLFPVAEKDYEADDFIAAEWEAFRNAIQEAYLLTIFGYSAPETDVAAREAMLQVWQSNQSRELAQILLIDIADEERLEEKWGEFFVRNHYGISAGIDDAWQLRHPRRSCDAFAMATLQVSPCRENPLPRFEDLSDLHKWLRPLIEEERRMYDDGEPLSC